MNKHLLRYQWPFQMFQTPNTLNREIWLDKLLKHHWPVLSRTGWKINLEIQKMTEIQQILMPLAVACCRSTFQILNESLLLIFYFLLSTCSFFSLDILPFAFYFLHFTFFSLNLLVAAAPLLFIIGGSPTPPPSAIDA